MRNALLVRDVVATIGPGHEHAVGAVPAHMRAFDNDPTVYVERVVNEFQQQVHDQLLDTAWPRCPRHPNHPMWFRNGAWKADGQRGAELGGLGSLGGSATGRGASR